MILWQVPRSPYTNILDFRYWMSLQSVVEREHYGKRCTTSSLVRSVERVWNTDDDGSTLLKIFSRLKIVLCNILGNNGSNDNVESDRGKKFEKLKSRMSSEEKLKK